MMNEKVLAALNEQFTRELFSSNLYLAMSSYFSEKNLNGFANWMRVQAKEEMDHAMLIYDYIIQRGAKAVISSIEKPKHEWESTLDVISDTLVHEKYITQSINELNGLAIQEMDYATTNFLQWFIKEQVEEEANVSDLKARLELSNNHHGPLFMLDNELKARVYVPHTITA